MKLLNAKIVFLIPVLIIFVSQLNCVSDKAVRSDEAKPIVENNQRN